MLRGLLLLRQEDFLTVVTRTGRVADLVAAESPRGSSARSRRSRARRRCCLTGHERHHELILIEDRVNGGHEARAR